MSPALTLAQLPDYASLTEILQFQATGLIVVFVALGSIWLLLEVIGTYFKRNAPAPVVAPAKAATPAPAPSGLTTPEGTHPAVVAAIAAAVHVVLKGRPHRIANISPVTTANPGGAWASEGRRDIFSSHRVR